MAIESEQLEAPAGWFEVGWIAAKLFVSADEPDVVMMRWDTDGLDYYRQVGMVNNIRTHLANMVADEYPD